MESSSWLMLQDTPLLRFDLPNREFEVRNADLLPIRLKGVFPGDGIYKLQDISEINTYDQYRDSIVNYLSGRLLNVDRENAKKILNCLQLSQSQDTMTRFQIAVACKNVSMTDDYWLNKGDLSLKWVDINPRKNHLNQIVAHVALTGSNLTATGLPHTPELTAQGAYAKAWIREDNGMYLYKAGTKGNQEHKIEVVVSNILDCFDIPHVKYEEAVYEDKELHRYLQVSKCKNMADDERCVVPAEDLYTYCARTEKNFLQEVLDIDSEGFCKTCVVDYLISNSDRHLLNWGFYQNNQTGEFLSLHPLFDHNNAFDEHDMQDPEGGKSLLLQGKTKKEAALYAMKRCHIHCIKPLTKDVFLNERQYESFMKRACELGLYREKEQNFFSKFKKEANYEPVTIEKAMIFAEKPKLYHNLQTIEEKSLAFSHTKFERNKNRESQQSRRRNIEEPEY